MAQPARSRFSFEEYLELEKMSGVRHEFLDGVAYAMAGGSLDHGAISVNVTGMLRDVLRGKPCRVFNSDVRVRVVATGLATYPDASIACEHAEQDPADKSGQTLVNPTLIVEVLSPSTESYDRGEKLGHYKQIESLREVMLVAHDEKRVDLWRRTERGWTQISFREGESVRLESLDCSLPVDEIYFDPLAG